MKNKPSKQKPEATIRNDQGLREILAFMKRLSEFEKRSQESNPLVG